MTDTAIPLIIESGCAAVTLRALADRMRITPSGVLRWFDSTARMGRVIAARYGQRWIQWILKRGRETLATRRGTRGHPMRCCRSPRRRWAGPGVWLALLEEARRRTRTWWWRSCEA